jgi:hypothetical protein
MFVSTLVIALALLASSTLFAQTTFSNIDDITATDNGTVGWGMCSNCAGGQVTSTYWMARNQTTPSTDGASTELFMSGQGYSNVPYYNKLGPLDSASHFTWDFWVQVDSTSSNAQTFEFDTFQFMNGRRYMFGTQCNYANGQWQIWNEGGKYWLNAGFACQKFVLTDTQMYYDSFSIQHQGRTTTQSLYALAEPSGPLPAVWGDNLGVQFQLDLWPSGGELHEWIDQVTLTAY